MDEMYQVTLEPSGHSFQVPVGKSILDAGLEAGFALPYSCRAAVCSACRVHIKSGQVEHGVVFGTLSTDDMAKGFALLCRSMPRSDVVVEVAELKGLEGIQSRTLPCRVVAVEIVARDVAILRIRLPNAEGMRFLAGQYIDFFLSDGERRSFSIATKPSRELVTEIELHIRRVEGGTFTTRIFEELRPRDILRLEAPLGTFYLREDSDKPIIMLASGTGFAPVKSMCEAALESGVFDRRPTTVYWGGRTREDLYMLDTAMAWSHPNLRFVPVLSEATAACAWTGATGFVHRQVMADFPDLSGHQVYACGAPIVIDSARTDFVDKCGLPVEEFLADPFLTGLERAAHPLMAAA
jgi:CDP-4-dehydro-6-deoxyglucose reductase, E3